MKKYTIYYNELEREVEIDENGNVVIDRKSFEALLSKANKMCDEAGASIIKIKVPAKIWKMGQTNY